MKIKLLILLSIIASNCYGLEFVTEPLSAAICRDNPVHVAEILNDGVGVDSVLKNSYNQPSLLQFAAQYRFFKVAELLIMRGANVNFTGSRGITPLGLSVAHDHYDIAKLLLQNKANPQIFGSANLNTPLGYAVFYDKIKLVKLLLNHGARLSPKEYASFEDNTFRSEPLSDEMRKLLILYHKPSDQRTEEDMKAIAIIEQEEKQKEKK